ncbi:hypothetical protein VTK56DRAFT_6901 [Thermocarpiscus australiensis]
MAKQFPGLPMERRVAGQWLTLLSSETTVVCNTVPRLNTVKPKIKEPEGMFACVTSPIPALICSFPNKAQGDRRCCDWIGYASSLRPTQRFPCHSQPCKGSNESVASMYYGISPPEGAPRPVPELPAVASNTTSEFLPMAVLVRRIKPETSRLTKYQVLAKDGPPAYRNHNQRASPRCQYR